MVSIHVSNSSVPFSPFFALHENRRLQYSRGFVRSVASENSFRLTPKSFRIKRTYAVYDDGRKKGAQNVDPEELTPLWDDGYGTQTINDYAEIAVDLINSDHGGPPRWFCPVACGVPIKNSPILLYLPGMDGTGAGLVLHEKALGNRISLNHLICSISAQPTSLA